VKSMRTESRDPVTRRIPCCNHPVVSCVTLAVVSPGTESLEMPGSLKDSLLFVLLLRAHKYLCARMLSFC